MLRTHRCLSALPTLVLATAACNSIRTTTDLQMLRMDEARSSFGKHFTYMVDNAILSDMSVADVHFVPHTSELNGIGEVRLDRMARLLNAYGGTVRYETTSDDSALVKQRIEHVREYLVLAGCSMDRVEVAVMMSGGDGMPGHEAVRKYQESTSPSAETDSGAGSPDAAGLGGLTSQPPR